MTVTAGASRYEITTPTTPALAQARPTLLYSKVKEQGEQVYLCLLVFLERDSRVLPILALTPWTVLNIAFSKATMYR
ncbi:hypothetical protein NSK_002087 [Nannochloropsis salina CCMP1776]|uniref:Uncharacterized protein n=1 Tax=Nannochloropsis salina CCMP1776 TaxID=1027361 RepID=A0A4D9D4R2_9STRA|nr:hypothetical protein NSK_002087 [Nannochloropsis salina CCMP1776]|eukprot:TFJ86430.1 hypothetical protein NSK_002087 [Nannochloropsis salina CCMP1776]